MSAVSSKHINAAYTAAMFIAALLFVAGCGNGKKSEAVAETNDVGKAQADSVGNALASARTWACGDSGGNVVATLKDDMTLIVRGTGAMADYNNDNPAQFPPWHDFKDSIADAVIEYGVTSVGNRAFEKCTSLVSISIPGSVKRIGGNVFLDCSNLTSVTIPNSVTYMGYGVFCGTGLTSATIPDSMTLIRAGTFAGCKYLKSVTIHDRVTGIEEAAFAGCTGLTSITIPSSVGTIWYNAFGGCDNLMSITVHRDSPPADGDCLSMFDGMGSNYFNRACLYVPANSVAVYRVSDAWKQFKCIRPVKSATQKAGYNIGEKSNFLPGGCG